MAVLLLLAHSVVAFGVTLPTRQSRPDESAPDENVAQALPSCCARGCCCGDAVQKCCCCCSTDQPAPDSPPPDGWPAWNTCSCFSSGPLYLDFSVPAIVTGHVLLTFAVPPLLGVLGMASFEADALPSLPDAPPPRG